MSREMLVRVQTLIQTTDSPHPTSALSQWQGIAHGEQCWQEGTSLLDEVMLSEGKL